MMIVVRKGMTHITRCTGFSAQIRERLIPYMLNNCWMYS
jgi:hypothetical protein